MRCGKTVGRCWNEISRSSWRLWIAVGSLLVSRFWGSEFSFSVAAAGVGTLLRHFMLSRSYDASRVAALILEVWFPAQFSNEN